jgi:hypothetical protein
VKRSIGLIDNIQGVLLDNLVSNEPPVNIESDELSMQVEKVMIKDAAQKNNVIKGAKFGTPSVGALGIGNSMLFMIIRRCLHVLGAPVMLPFACTVCNPCQFIDKYLSGLRLKCAWIRRTRINSMCLKPYI